MALFPRRDTCIWGPHQWYLVKSESPDEEAVAGAFFTSEHDAIQAAAVAGVMCLEAKDELAHEVRKVLP
jgi:hypothetical protein